MDRTIIVIEYEYFSRMMYLKNEASYYPILNRSVVWHNTYEKTRIKYPYLGESEIPS